MKKYILGLDIGGTKTSAALFNMDGSIVGDYVHTAKSPTFKGEEEVYQNTKNVLIHILNHFSIAREKIAGIGVGSPGPLNTKTGVIVHAPLMGWRNFPIIQRLTMDFNKPVVLDNDGNLGALAEQRYGVAKGLNNIIYMTVSTGCGAGIILNGEIYRGCNDGAGEVGHMSIDLHGLKCACGSNGCFELYASGTALLNIMRKDMARGVKSKVFELAQYSIENLDGKLLTQAAVEGDHYALELYKQEGDYLGIGIANLCNLYDPQTVVLGGGVTKAKKFFEKSLMLTLKERCIQPIKEDLIRYSTMNDRVVLYGAFCLIKQQIEEH